MKQRRKTFRYRTAPTPLVFPTDVGAKPETRRHYEQRTTLFQVAKLAFGQHASIGSNQLLFWNASNPSRWLSPELFIRLGAQDFLFDVWKTWEFGAPQVVVEILNDADATELVWQERLSNYREIGVEELIRFDPVAPVEALRIWDRVQNDLVERELDDDQAAMSAVLGLYWVVIKDPVLGRMLRLGKDGSGGRLLPTPTEFETMKREEIEKRLSVFEFEGRKP